MSLINCITVLLHLGFQSIPGRNKYINIIIYVSVLVTYILSPSYKRSPYIFTLVKKVTHRVYKFHAEQLAI